MATYIRTKPEIVEAWQYPGGGAMPLGPIWVALEPYHPHHMDAPYSEGVRRMASSLGIALNPSGRNDYLYWAYEGNNRCGVGDWIVLDEDGRLDIWPDETFRETFREAT